MQRLCFIIGIIFSLFSAQLSAQPLWATLPPTPTLPTPTQSGMAPINNIKIWYATYGKGEPVIMLHGGLANSNYWGNQVPELAKHYQVIVMDSRGHGRSTNDDKTFSYELMATDVIALMDYLKIKRAAIVGWSDGADIGLAIAIHHPERLTKLFAFGGNASFTGVREVNSPVFNAYFDRAQAEYKTLSATPTQNKALIEQITHMWASQPNFTKAQLNSIKTPVWIVDGDHEEGIKREHTEMMAAEIPNAGLLILPLVSHFAFLQDPIQFNNDVLHFLTNTNQ